MKKLFFVLIHSFSITLWAQYPTYHHFSDDIGLPSNEVYSIIQDHKGFIWIGSDAGLYRYNGVRFQKYFNANQKSAALTGLLLSNDSVIYCYNFSNQLFYVQHDSLYEIKTWEGKRKIGFPNIAVDRSNTLWVTAENELYGFDRHKNVWRKTEIALAARDVSGVITDNDGQIWYSENGSIRALGQKLYPIQYLAKGSRNLAEYFLCVDKDILWLISVAGGYVYQLQDEIVKPYSSEKLHAALRERKVSSVKSFNNKLFITTYSGVLIYDKQTDDVEVWYPNETFSSSLIDKEGNIWLSTLRNGIYFIPEKEFKVWNKQESQLPENRITDIDVAPDALFFAMQNGFIGRLNLKTNKVSFFSNQTKADVRTIYFDETEDKLYFNTNNILYAFNQKGITKISDQVGPLKKMTKVADNFIVCTSLGAFSYKDLKDIKTCRSLTPFWSRDAAFIAHEQILLIATNFGLEKGEFINGLYKADTTLLPNIQIVALFQEPKSNIVWALTFAGEIYTCNATSCNKIGRVPIDARLFDMVLHQQKIYIATSHGLWIYDIVQNTWSNINRLSGLASNDIQALQINEDKLWLATAKGLQSIPLGYSHTKPLPSVYLKNILIDEEKTTVPYLNLDYNSTLRISAEAVNYFSLQNFQFAYRVFGSDTTWKFVNSADEYFTVAGLKSGNFAIEIAVVDYLGRFSQNNIFIGGRVIPPFWQRWWFYFIIGIAGVGIAYLFFLLRIKSLQKKQAENIARIKLESELAISQQTALKAQMNPHFIFNVLNSIKSYIYENDKKSAANYLSKFADLTRGILAMSSQPMVKLSHELKALQLYMDLEALQMESPFHYDIILSDLIDADLVQIPSLIIQPFLENSFKHGLRHKSGEKILILTIDLIEDVNQLSVVIEDNGIGRAKSAEINTASGEIHQSFATDASTQRLHLLNKGKQEKVNVVFEDKKDKLGHALGTRVTLTIQL